MSHWKALEPLVVEDAVRALRRLLDDNPEERFYVAAFHGVYRECDGIIALPSLAANTVSARGDEDRASPDFWDADWNPADWDHELIDYESPALRAAAKAADSAARRGSRADWLQAEKDCFDMLASASRKVREALGGAPPLTPDFVVFVHDEEYANALARRCLGDETFERTFTTEAAADRERARVAALPVAERVAFLIGRLDRFDGAISAEEAAEQLCAIGAPAVPALLERMRHGKGKDRNDHAWRGARLLGRIGTATPEVLDALKTQMVKSRDEPGRHWAARALAYLGLSDWLLSQLAQADGTGTGAPSDTARAAIEGLCAPYSAFRDRTPLPLDYRPLEALLAGPPATVGAARRSRSCGRAAATASCAPAKSTKRCVASARRVPSCAAMRPACAGNADWAPKPASACCLRWPNGSRTTTTPMCAGKPRAASAPGSTKASRGTRPWRVPQRTTRTSACAKPRSRCSTARTTDAPAQRAARSLSSARSRNGSRSCPQKRSPFRMKVGAPNTPASTASALFTR